MSFYQCIEASQRQVPVISTIPEAIIVLRRIIINTPADDAAAVQNYEKAQSNAVVQCAKVLYDNAYAQILNTLEEIDNRVAYRRSKKNHPWSYFVTKHP